MSVYCKIITAIKVIDSFPPHIIIIPLYWSFYGAVDVASNFKFNALLLSIVTLVFIDVLILFAFYYESQVSLNQHF